MGDSVWPTENVPEASERGQELSPYSEKGVCHQLTIAIVQEVSDESSTAGRPGLFRVHVSHDRSHDVARGPPLPIQVSAWFGVIMEHVEDMAYKRKGPAGVQKVHPCPHGAPSYT